MIIRKCNTGHHQIAFLSNIFALEIVLIKRKNKTKGKHYGYESFCYKVVFINNISCKNKTLLPVFVNNPGAHKIRN